MELFSLKNKYALDNPIHKIDFIKYSPSSLATINNTNSNVSILFPGEAYICLQNSYNSIEFQVFKQDNTQYVRQNQISLVNIGPIAFLVKLNWYLPPENI